MTEKRSFSLRLALDGAAEILRGLRDLKTAGAEVGKQLGDAVKDTADATKDLVDGLTDAGEAAKGIEAPRVQTAEVTAAMRSLGVVTEETIRKQEEAIKGALQAVEQSGTASAREVEQAQKVAADKLRDLYRRAGMDGEESAEQVADAYQRLGLTMSEDVEAEAREIRLAFERIRDSGTASADDVADAQKRMVRQLRELEDRTGRSVTRFGELRMRMGELRSAVADLGIAIGTVGTAFGMMVNRTAANVDQQAKAASAMGLTVKEYGRLTYAMEQNGVAADKATEVLGNIAQIAQETVQAEGEASKARAEAMAEATKAEAEYQAAYQKGQTLLAQAQRLTGKAREDALKQAAAANKDAAKAAEALQRAQEKVAEAATKADTPLKELGISARDASGNVRNAKDILLDMSEAFRQMPDGTEKAALAIKLFGEEDGPAMVNVLNQGKDAIEALGDEAERLRFVLDEKASKAADDYRKSMNELGQALEMARVSGVTPLLGPLSELAGAFTNLITGLQETSPALAGAVGLMTGLLGPLVEILPQVGLAVIALKGLAPGIAPIGAAFGGLVKGIGLLMGGLKTLSLFLLTNPIGWIVLAVAAAAAAIIVYWDDIKVAAVASWEWIQETVSSVMDWIGEKVSAVAGSVVGAWESVTAWFTSLPERILGVFDSLGQTLVAKLAEWAGYSDLSQEQIVQAWEQGKAMLLDVLTAPYRDAAAFIAETWETVKGLATALVDWLGGLYDTVLAALTAPFQAAAEAIKGIWDDVMGWISDAIDAVKSFLSLSSKADAKGGGGGKGYAGGGEVVGPGTGTSDSIVSWLSNGEFVIKAAAVRRYGKTLFHRLNNMAVPPMPAFAAGGLVGSLPGPAPLPLLSADLGTGGGAGAAGTPVNLHLDGQRVGGIRAAGDPFEDLQRAGRFRVAPPSRHSR